MTESEVTFILADRRYPCVVEVGLLAGLPDANSLRKPEVVRSARFNATYIGNDEWLIQTLFDPIERKSPRLSFDRWVLNERTGQAVQYGGDRQQVEAFCPRTR